MDTSDVVVGYAVGGVLKIHAITRGAEVAIVLVAVWSVVVVAVHSILRIAVGAIMSLVLGNVGDIQPVQSEVPPKQKVIAVLSLDRGALFALLLDIAPCEVASVVAKLSVVLKAQLVVISNALNRLFKVNSIGRHTVVAS